MSPLIKKEIRLLLPAWIAAMLLAITPIWISPVWSRFPSVADPYVELALVLGGLILSIASFGQEFSFGTFSVLISQPIERRRIWIIKTAVHAGAFVSVLSALAVSWELYFFTEKIPAPYLLTAFGKWALFVAVIFSSGLWTTLLFRRVLEAFWLTLLTPIILMSLLVVLSEYFHWPNKVNNYVIPTVLLLYSATGFFWARRLFLRAQDLQWAGGVIAFSRRKRVSEPTKVSSRPRHWLSALVGKELQLQQVNILIAVVVLGLHLTSLIIRQVHPNFANPNVRGLLELIWMLWLLMPLLIGSAAVAEERRVGIVESQFCLPVTRRTQFVVKFLFGLILSLVLGGLVPFVIERGHELNYYVFVIAAAIFFISFYASTLARTTLQAIGLTLVLSAVIYLYLAAAAIARARFGYSYTYAQLGLTLLKVRLGIPILLLVLAYLTLGNFKWLQPDWKLWRRNLITALSAFAVVSILNHAIYFRAWDWLTPIPQPHGPARLSASFPIKIGFNFRALSVLLPDGRLWIETLAYDSNAWLETLALERCKASYIVGSNWTDVAQSSTQILAIQSDGSLWRAEKRVIERTDGWYNEIGKFSRLGSQTNWQGVATSRFGSGGFLLLTKGGSLWSWGTNWTRTSSGVWVLDLKTPPKQIDHEMDWTEVLPLGGYACARKQNGSLWRWEPTRTNSTFRLVQETNLEFVLSLADNSPWRARVNGHGELWLSWSTWTNDHDVTLGTIQLGKDSKWRAVAFANDSFLGLRGDGTLWRWTYFGNLSRVANLASPTQAGNYSHWIVLDDRSATSLAADGSLWSWDEASRHLWLAPSRKPVYLGNIFTAQ